MVFPGKNTGMGCHFLLQGGLPDPGIEPILIGRQLLYRWDPEKPQSCVLATSIAACVGLSTGSSLLLWKLGDKNSRRWSMCAPPNLEWGTGSQCPLNVSWASLCCSASLVVRLGPMACTWMWPVFSIALEFKASESTPSCLLPQHLETTCFHKERQKTWETFLTPSDVMSGAGTFPGCYWGFLGGSVLKNLLANAGDTKDAGSIPGLGRSSGVGNGNPLQYPCLENSINRGAWRATVHGVAKSQTWLSACVRTHTPTHTYTHTHTDVGGDLWLSPASLSWIPWGHGTRWSHPSYTLWTHRVTVGKQAISLLWVFSFLNGDFYGNLAFELLSKHKALSFNELWCREPKWKRKHIRRWSSWLRRQGRG